MQFPQSIFNHCGGSHPTNKLFKQPKKGKGNKKTQLNTRNNTNKRNEHNAQKPNTCFRCGSEIHFIVNGEISPEYQKS